MGNNNSGNPGGGSGPLSSITNCCGRDRDLISDDEIKRNDKKKGRNLMKPI